MWSIWMAAMASTPAKVQLTYRVGFDLDANADKVCSMTQICDCSAVYEGTGKLSEQAGDRIRFEGTWRRVESNCNAAFDIWVPADGHAFHSFQVGPQLTEWVVHGDKSNSKKRTSAIKEHQQFWIDSLNVPWPTKSAKISQIENGSLGMGLGLRTTHSLELQFEP